MYWQVSRPEYKLRWEKSLLHSEVVKKFSPDFVVMHSIYEAPAVTANRDAVLAYLTTKQSDGTLLCLVRSVPYGNIPIPHGHLRLNIEISGFLVRPLSETSCAVTYLLQLREVRRANVITWKVARRKRMISVLRLKEYAESLSSEELAEIVPSSLALTPPPPVRPGDLRTSPSASVLQIGRARK